MSASSDKPASEDELGKSRQRSTQTAHTGTERDARPVPDLEARTEEWRRMMELLKRNQELEIKLKELKKGGIEDVNRTRWVTLSRDRPTTGRA